MIIAQFTNTYAVDSQWKDTFLFYTNDKKLYRLGSDPDFRASGYKNLVTNTDQENKNEFRLIFKME
jgi:hypothetical protein